LRQCIGTIVVYRARQQDPGTGGAGRRDTVIDHGQHQLLPMPVAGRIDSMHDQACRCTLQGSSDHLITLHGIALQPLQAGVAGSATGGGGIAVQGPDLPAVALQAARQCAADAAGGAEYQGAAG